MLRSNALRRVSCFTVIAALTAVAACGKKDSNVGPANTSSVSVAAFAGASQSATVGHAVATAPAVKVTNSAGVPQSGVLVTFAVTGGGGSLTGATQTTGADGVATVTAWTLGTVAGTNSLSATASGAAFASVSTTITATATAGAAATLSKIAGDAITSAAGIAVSTKAEVKVVDSFGNGVSGVVITFADASGGGSVTGATQTTAADGTATVGGWTLGNVAAANTLTATVTGGTLNGTAVTFAATGAAGPVATLTKTAGDAQSAVAGALLAISPAVQLKDQFGNVVSSQVVNFAVVSGGGSVTGAAPTSNATGLATVGGWTLGSALGANTMSATANGVSVTFTATALSAFNASQYAGTYNGTWTNTTFGSTGTGSALVAVNTGAGTATVTVNVTGTVLGTGGVSNAVNNGAYTNNGTSFNGNVAPMGTITATMSAAGAITASGVNPTNTSISGWTATGTVTATALNMTYTVTFTNGSTAVGTITMTKP